MNWDKLLTLFLIIAGTIIIACWMIVDIFGTEKLNPTFAVIGLLVTMMGSNELNHIKLMEKLNEPKTT